jgi:hypothetical protein
MELFVICLVFGVIGTSFIKLIRKVRLQPQPRWIVVSMLVTIVAGGILVGIWGHTVDVSTASRPSGVDVPYWVWMQPATDDAWQIWADPLGRDNDRRYSMPKESRCQMFHVNRRRLVPLSGDDRVTTARYEIHWLYRVLDRFDDECAHGTVIRLTSEQRGVWLPALAGWGL